MTDQQRPNGEGASTSPHSEGPATRGGACSLADETSRGGTPDLVAPEEPEEERYRVPTEVDPLLGPRRLVEADDAFSAEQWDARLWT